MSSPSDEPEPLDFSSSTDFRYFSSRHHLTVDAMFLRIAQTNYNVAMQAFDKSTDLLERLTANPRWDTYVAYDLGDEADPDWEPGELDAFTLADERLFAAFGQFLQSAATVHVFCAAALEAHINARAFVRLNPTQLSAFKNLSHKEKWRQLPLLLGCRGFDAKAHPFVGLEGLIRVRNGLIHYREETSRRRDKTLTVIAALRSFRREECKRSLDAARSIIAELATLLGERVPYWMASEPVTFLAFGEQAGEAKSSADGSIEGS